MVSRPPAIEAYVEFSLHVAEDVTFCVVPLLMVAVAVYWDELPSFTDDAPLIAMLLTVGVAATTVKELLETLRSP